MKILPTIIFLSLVAICFSALSSCGGVDCTSSKSAAGVVQLITENGTDTSSRINIPQSEEIILADPYSVTSSLISKRLPNLTQGAGAELIEASNARESVMVAIIVGDCISEIAWLDDRYRVRNPESVLLLRGQVQINIEQTEDATRSLVIFVDDQ